MANTLTHLALLSKVLRVQSALETKDMVRLADALGMTEDLMRDMTLQEVSDCLAVRLHDLTTEMEKYL